MGNIIRIDMKLFGLSILGLAAAGTTKWGCGDYGCANDMDTTGCSSQTGSQDGCGSGISCSRKMAQTDNRLMEQYKTKIKNAAHNKKLDGAVVASIISRESRAGGALTSDGWGDCHGGTCYGFGLMQIDKRYHNPQGSWNSIQHIEQGCQILVDTINCVKRKHTSWTKDMYTKGGISGYNAGCGNVQTYDGMDIGTTGNDYSSDCVARGQWYSSNGYT